MRTLEACGTANCELQSSRRNVSYREPLFLQISWMCSGFAMKSDEFKTTLVDRIVLIAYNLNFDVTFPPSEKKAEPIPRVDPTIAKASKV